jgi:hypothetical protein
MVVSYNYLSESYFKRNYCRLLSVNVLWPILFLLLVLFVACSFYKLFLFLLMKK